MSWDEGAQCVGGAVIFSLGKSAMLAFGLVSIVAASMGLEGHKDECFIREKSNTVFVLSLIHI